jgi:hydroxymethylpyrimidine/phosphomethylpyrimidine kinase
MRGRVLVVAGSDSGAGAGIQADLKTVFALGGYATTAITALTAQDTTGVHGVLPVPPAFVALQMRVVLEDIGADAIKTGMLGDAELIEAVCAALPGGVPVVVDPVMLSTSGARLLPDDAVAVLRARLLPLAAVLTPNIPEAEALCSGGIADVAAMRDAARMLLEAGPAAVLLKGGHLPGSVVYDVLATATGMDVFDAPRIDSRHTHGTGCTLASAVATGLARGAPLREAVLQARAYVRAAIAAAPGLGRGHGPLGHSVG